MPAQKNMYPHIRPESEYLLFPFRVSCNVVADRDSTVQSRIEFWIECPKTTRKNKHHRKQGPSHSDTDGEYVKPGKSHLFLRPTVSRRTAIASLAEDAGNPWINPRGLIPSSIECRRRLRTRPPPVPCPVLPCNEN
jgi:hypothetical protein